MSVGCRVTSKVPPSYAETSGCNGDQSDNVQSVSIDLAAERLSAEDARTLLNRFLSMISWCQDQHAVLGDGWSGNPIPVPIPRLGKSDTIASPWFFSRSLPDDPELLQRLAYYREGLNAREAGLVTFAVLSFFKVFERREKSDRRTPNPTKIWIRNVFDAVASTLPAEVLQRFDEARKGKDVEKCVFENCRVATAHASEEFPSDADASPEIRRERSERAIVVIGYCDAVERGKDSRPCTISRPPARILALIVDNSPDCPIHERMDSTSEIMGALRAGRALLGLSQEELAGLAGVSRQIVVRIEKGETNVLVESIEKVRAALEAGGVAFIEGCAERGPGVAMIRRPRAPAETE